LRCVPGESPSNAGESFARVRQRIELDGESTKVAIALAYVGSPEVRREPKGVQRSFVERQGTLGESKLVENLRKAVERDRAAKKSGCTLEGLHPQSLLIGATAFRIVWRLFSANLRYNLISFFLEKSFVEKRWFAVNVSIGR